MKTNAARKQGQFVGMNLTENSQGELARFGCMVPDGNPSECGYFAEGRVSL